jgi:hypothetical protein
MGILTDLQRSFAYRLKPTQFVRWIDAVSSILDGLVPGGGAQANTRYVALNGNDATGDGSFEKPFLTVARAMTSITTATATNPWTVDVGPGVFATSFTVKNGVFVRGAGSGSGNYNGSPTTANTVLAPDTVQALAADWAGAGQKTGGISQCAFSQDFQADFATVGTTGDGYFLIDDVLTQNDVIFVGNGATGTSFATVKDLYINAAVDLKFIEMSGSTTEGLASDYGGNVVFTQSAAIQGFHDIVGSLVVGGVSLTWTSALITNFLRVTMIGGASGLVNPTIVGAGSVLISDGVKTIAMADAAKRLSFGDTAAATLLGMNVGVNRVVCTPTANRVLTIDAPQAVLRLTTIIVQNLAAATFVIDLTLNSGTISPGSPTYVPPGGQVTITYDNFNSQWSVTPYVQRGQAAIAGGVSAALIPADVTARSSITITQATFSGAAGTPLAKSADVVIGTRVGGGGFKIHSVALATGADVATDNGTYNWQIAG